MANPDEHDSLVPLAVDLPTGAKLAGLGFSKFRELTVAGEIPTLRIGSRRLVRPAAIAAYLERIEAETMATRRANQPD